LSTALRIISVSAAILAGLVLAAMVLFGGPNYYGLRPHAVDKNLERYDVRDLAALAQNGSTTGISTYDAW
jgi:hypothetical protein